MTQPTNFRVATRRFPATLAAVMLALVTLLVGCSGGEQEKEEAKKSGKPVPTITAVPEMKYYVGGPVMKHDAHGRLRLGGFSGEVGTPTSRGLLIGYKLEADGKTFDYRTWVNGRPVSKSSGFLDASGLLWFTNRETFDSAGKVIARQSYTYDDATKTMQSTVDQLDPETGEVIQTYKQEIPYTPVEEPDDEEGSDDDAPSKDDTEKSLSE